MKAIKANACGVIMCLYHQSSNIKPRDADLKITQKVKEAAALHEKTVLDNLVITEEGYYSMADNGCI